MTRLVVGITGASGSIYGIRLLEILRATTQLELHLVISNAGKRTLVEETDLSVADVEALAHHRYDVRDIGATLASGSERRSGSSSGEQIDHEGCRPTERGSAESFAGRRLVILEEPALLDQGDRPGGQRVGERGASSGAKASRSASLAGCVGALPPQWCQRFSSRSARTM